MRSTHYTESKADHSSLHSVEFEQVYKLNRVKRICDRELHDKAFKVFECLTPPRFLTYYYLVVVSIVFRNFDQSQLRNRGASAPNFSPGGLGCMVV